MKIWQGIRSTMKKQQGFTLIELLVVVAIIGVLAAIAIPKFVDATATANGGKVLADLQSIDSAIQQYAASLGREPSAIVDDNTTRLALGAYFSSGFPNPPTGGNIKIKGKAVTASGSMSLNSYTISSGRANFAGKTAEELAAGNFN